MKLSEITAKYLKGQKKHTIMTVTAVIVSVAFLTVLLSALSVYRASALASAREKGTYHVIFNGLTKDEYVSIKNMDLFEKTQNYGVSSFTSRTDLDFGQMEKENAHTEYLVLSSHLVEDLFLRTDGDMDLLPKNMYMCSEGRMPEKDGEIAISYDSAYMWGYPAVGDTVDAMIVSCSAKKDSTDNTPFMNMDVPLVLAETFQLEEVKNISFTVVGYTDEYNVVSYNDTQLKTYSSQFEQMVARYKPSVKDIYWGMDHAFRDVGLEIDDFEYSLNSELLDAEGLGVDAKFNTAIFFAVMYLFIIFIMFCARLVIDDSFEISAKERIKQFGLLKAVGASKKQIFKMLVIEAVYLAVPGIIVGVLVGTGLSFAIFSVIKAVVSSSDTVLSNMVFSVKPYVYISAIVMGLLWVIISAVATGMRSIRSTPVETLTAAGRAEQVNVPRRSAGTFKHGFIRTYSSLSVRRNTKRFIITIVSMVMSIVLFTGFSYGIRLMKENTENEYTVLREPYDYSVNYYTFEPSEVFDAADKMTANGFDDVQMYSRFLMLVYNADLGADSTYTPESALMNIMPVNRQTFEKYIKTDISFDEFESSGKLLLCADHYNENYVYDFRMYSSAPESIKGKMFFSTDMHIDEDDTELPVLGLYSTDNRLYRTRNTMPAAIVSDSTYMSMLGTIGRDDYTNVNTDINGEPADLYYFKLVANSADANAAKKYLDRNFYNLYENNSASRADAEALIKVVTIAGYFVVMIISLIAVINIVNIISANVLNRSAELAMLRACGMSDGQLHRLLFSESTIYAGISGLISLVLVELTVFVVQIPFKTGFHDLDFDDLNFSFSYTTPLIYLVIAVAAAFLIAAAASYIAAGRTLRSSIVENIRSMEQV
ncbi:MAG: ABC transporter permease [Oscillospiraceae bacterium]|nr:ABC transporter permease [Oscillospiraceae bacterium]